MASPDLILDERQKCGDVTLPVNPFVSNQYHFGMLLGVADLEAEQAYHRGKVWLHNAWLHGCGTVWGLEVAVDAQRGEVVVEPGLAIDEHGRELHVADRMCIDVAAWIAVQDEAQLAVEDVGDGSRTFTTHVELCHDSCLDRPVPSISEPCESTNFDTAYSRAVERGLPRMLPGNAPEPKPALYPRLRQFFGQRSPSDPLVVEALQAIEAAAAPQRPAVCLNWFRILAAEDTMAMRPEDSAAYSPWAGDGCVLLAEIGFHVRDDDGTVVVVASGDAPTAVDNHVRPSHVRTRTTQELLCHGHAPDEILAIPPEPDADADTEPTGSGSGTGTGTDAAPQLRPDNAEISGGTISLHFTEPLDDATVSSGAFRVSVLRNDGWAPSEVRRAELDDDGETVTLVLTGRPRSRPIRIIAEGAGSSPILGANHRPLAGTEGQPSVPTGADGVAMIVDDDTPDGE